MEFENGWCVSVQFGYGNYADNYSFQGDPGDDYAERNRKAGDEGSNTAECAVFDSAGEMVTLPDFMFPPDSAADIVSNRSTPAQVLQLMNWAASQAKAESK